MKEQFCDIFFIFTSVILFSAISYFAGAFIFITIPKEIIEPYPGDRKNQRRALNDSHRARHSAKRF